ncbi:MAG TPA: VTT domain-containing protein [Cyclobacteriaceae bacterium]|nr:VTT domain-containing protein [Cyclobacteriaceae bacterium]
MASGLKSRFFISNFLKGLAWLALFVIGYIIFKRYVHVDFLDWLEPVFNNTLLMFSIYTMSEIIVGIIPPEIFFIWATRSEEFDVYLQYAMLLAIISYLAALLAYWFGRKLSNTLLFRFLKRKYLSKYLRHLETYGFFLIVVAALTPLPYSGTSMLMGSLNYPFRKFWIYAATRFIRYAIYTFAFWEVAFA